MRRKLTTIVAADLVGYSRLISEDEGAVLSALELLRKDYIAPKALANSGRIFRFLGDGTLLEFDSALGAVEFAIDVQRSLAEYNAENPGQIPIVLRIGINLGDVVFENSDIHGDGVNIAVRIEALAEPGGICLTDSVYAQIKHRIGKNFISVGQRSLKNIIDPVYIWRWRPALDTPLPEAIARLSGEAALPSGQHILDPKLVDLLLRLHTRSALLAVSNSLDAIVDDRGDRVRFDQLYYQISEHIHHARELLSSVRIERVDNYRELSTSGAKHQTLGEFMSSMFNDAKLGFAFKIIPEAQVVLASDEPAMVKRKRFMDLVRRFQDEEYLASCRNQIKFAYME